MALMSLQFGGKLCKKTFRWEFVIPDVCGNDPVANILPPEKSARPTLSFKEANVNHLIEDVYYPVKPDWKPITVVMYDITTPTHPVFEWIKKLYNPAVGSLVEPNSNGFIKECQLRMLNGCGDILESWIYEDCWPQSINFNTLDMGQTAVMYVEVTLRYARAYIDSGSSSVGSFSQGSSVVGSINPR
jgi:hypothetical protein